MIAYQSAADYLKQWYQRRVREIMETELTFTFPPIYNLPPFFTLQPVLNTRKKQLQLWCELVLEYVRFHKLFELEINEAANLPLFHNKHINRRFSPDGILSVLEELMLRGNAEWVMEKSRARIYWRTPSEWGAMLYAYVVKQALTGTVCTIYELRESDEVKDEEFFQLDLTTFMKALNILEQQHKAKIIQVKSNVGVKFFDKISK
eukprot:TRINITY_DN9134_c0_g2_i2.p1 TRINITY_DN9134_c0_g2~~TRINITY_DN9134_c0_g2_i2.p1  ORF type:complete len:239 (-),score=42.32 TRINITY_DN9134_c0_g2_i2:110-724(-)